MSCEACRAALSATEDKVNEVNKCTSEPCGCEKYRASENSPGPVLDEETLNYLVPTPDGRTESGHINPLFMNQVALNGLSVLRNTASNSEFELTIKQLRPRWESKERKLEGIVSFDARSVRYLEGKRLCCIYDTALPDKPNHADVMSAPWTGPEQVLTRRQLSQRKKIVIKEIIDQIGTNFSSAASFRDGSLILTTKSD
ncbi:hypothetical protein [Thalassospira sp. GB04J01]|uniref:hypothetical protein n=1 Tax=Thalassospira sp. GB04J01 TaxID=1485225 RepID=UPI0011AF018D|nr:hypothetical protein [Thalassospira sp. GB04J01]|tara:strand:- start:195 stop:791 length:597 start_codon:yes stop_codon:yes gene_type:complete